MADYIVKDTELTSVANAIRTAGGTNSLLSFPNGFVNAVGNISGGSSDFSTAEVTVTNDLGSLVNLEQCTCCVNEGGLGEGSPAVVSDILVAFGPLEHGTTATYRVPLYKGACLWIISAEGIIDTTGDVTNINGPMYLITGDCTITIS